MKLVTLTSCPMAQSCNSNICCFDEGYLNRSHHRSEPICKLFRDDIKQAAIGKTDGVMFIVCGLPISSHRFRAETRYNALNYDLQKVAKRLTLGC